LTALMTAAMPLSRQQVATTVVPCIHRAMNWYTSPASYRFVL